VPPQEAGVECGQKSENIRILSVLHTARFPLHGYVDHFANTSEFAPNIQIAELQNLQTL
jgi:hypothetical protein